MKNSLSHLNKHTFTVAVIKHYEDFHEDQFDFHMYCIRKVTLRSYCKLLRFEDELWGLPHYGRAAEEVIRLHLRLLDGPAGGEEDAEPDYSKMTPAERKKAKNIARKKAKKKAAAAAAAGGGGGDSKGAQDNGGSGGGGAGNKKKSRPHAIDEDPEGKELLAADHLAEAKKYASILVRHAPRRMSAWALQYDVSARRGKMLMALQVSFLPTRCFCPSFVPHCPHASLPTPCAITTFSCFNRLCAE